jgi:hypothetical protein
MTHNASLPYATRPELVLYFVQPTMAGSYEVVIANGLSVATSAVARLTVNTDPAPPLVLSPPRNTTVFEHQRAVFEVSARGLPAPTFQWRSNNVDIPGAVGARLELPDARPGWSGARFSVQVSNALGSASVSALLTVTPRPDLRFTEVMALPFDEEGNRHFDWFELTNYGTNAIDLTGWRFSDQPSFARSFVITNALVLSPGESAVFAERLDRRLFGDWWGQENLPAGLKFCTYSGFGLGYLGDQLFLWNAAAIDPNDSLATVSWAAATLGVSFECQRVFCDPDSAGCVDEVAGDSRVGWRGAFRAATAMDIGSPGYVTNPPLRILSLSRPATGSVAVSCRVTPGRIYRLRRTTALGAGEWELIVTNTAMSNVLTLADPQPMGDKGCFYRVEEVP